MYPVLKSPESQIRLFKVKRVEADKVFGTLDVFDLSTVPSFYALSYTWGEEKPTKPLVIGEGVMKIEIRMNLGRFLTSFAGLSAADFAKAFCSDALGPTEAHLWIDQVCIDQSSIPEKNSQVALMSKIYSSPTEVICWPSNSQAEMELIDEALKDWLDPKRHPGDNVLLEARYWSRAWIQQEILLAREVRIFGGTRSLPWQEFGRWDDKWVRANPIGTLSRVLKERFIAGGSLLSLDSVIDTFLECQCTEVRDHIYAFMSLVQPPERLPIDYSMPVMRLWWYYIRSSLKGHLAWPPGNSNIRLSGLDVLLAMPTTANLGMDRDDCLRIVRRYVGDFSKARIANPALTLEEYGAEHGDPYDRFVAARSAE
jgi:hypothetical protein